MQLDIDTRWEDKSCKRDVRRVGVGQALSESSITEGRMAWRGRGGGCTVGGM